MLLTQLTASLGRNATLDDIPDSELDNMQAKGFEWIWFLSVWQTGNEGQRISRTHEGWRKDFYETLPDLRDEDIVGSGFAITAYTVHEKLGGDAALARVTGLAVVATGGADESGKDEVHADEGVHEVRASGCRMNLPEDRGAKEVDRDPYGVLEKRHAPRVVRKACRAATHETTSWVGERRRR